MHTKNDRALLKEIQGDTNSEWTDIPCSWIGKLNVVKVFIPPRAIYRVNEIPIKISVACFFWQK